MYETLTNNGINYQPQLVSRISAINRINTFGKSISQLGNLPQKGFDIEKKGLKFMTSPSIVRYWEKRNCKMFRDLPPPYQPESGSLTNKKCEDILVITIMASQPTPLTYPAQK